MGYLFKGNTSPGLIFFVVTLLFSSSCFGEDLPEGGAVPLTLKDAIATAFRNNRSLQIQEREIDAAGAEVFLSRSPLLPKFSAGAGYTRNDAVLGTVLPASQGAEKDPGIFTGYEDDYRVAFSLDETLYSGGANTSLFRRSRIRLKMEEETLRARKLDVEFETKRLFFGLLLAQETARITQELVGLSQSHYEDVRNKFEQGASSRFDVLQSKVQVSKLIPELVKAKNAVDIIENDLKKLLGLKMRGSVKLMDKLEYSALEIKEDEFLQRAYDNKPEMVLRSLGVDAGSLSVKAAAAGRKPKVSGGLDYFYRSDDAGELFNDRHNNWSAGIVVTIPIFDGFSTKAKVDEAKARYEQTLLEKEDLKEQIAVDIRRACLELKQAEAIISSQRDNIEEAKEALKIAETSYSNGEATNLDILDSQVSLSQIEKNLSDAIYDYCMARAALDRYTGHLISEEEKQ